VTDEYAILIAKGGSIAVASRLLLRSPRGARLTARSLAVKEEVDARRETWIVQCATVDVKAGLRTQTQRAGIWQLQSTAGTSRTWWTDLRPRTGSQQR